MEKFTIKFQYQECLKRLGMDESKMIPEQKKQLRMMFYAASAQMLLLLRDEASELPFQEAVDVLEGMLTEIRQYLDGLMKLQN
jgi:hypothetical protein